MNIEDHPAFQALADAVRQLKADRQQALNDVFDNPVENYLTVKDIAEIMQVCEWTVRRWIKSGKLPAIRNKVYCISLPDFALFIEQHKKENHSSPKL